MTVGYSGTPLPTKLGIRDGGRVALLGAPDDLVLEPLAPGVRIGRRLSAGLDVVVLFVTRRADYERRFDAVVAALTPAGGFWVAWPKKASGVTTDLTENVIRDIAIDRGLVDNKVCAIDDVWSGLRLVRRLRDRPGSTVS
ncbi:MAG TPA: DUF3052 domain-containing protein [Acidimicrobiales bacterium]|nr:DUF3052 domain-containing protein [Acidimicrobiales bacterium]